MLSQREGVILIPPCVESKNSANTHEGNGAHEDLKVSHNPNSITHVTHEDWYMYQSKRDGYHLYFALPMADNCIWNLSP